MADDVIISWNFANWVTIVLMVAVLFVAVATFHKVAQSKSAQPSS